jgi:hypothetical protein
MGATVSISIIVLAALRLSTLCLVGRYRDPGAESVPCVGVSPSTVDLLPMLDEMADWIFACGPEPSPFTESLLPAAAAWSEIAQHGSGARSSGAHVLRNRNGYANRHVGGCPVKPLTAVNQFGRRAVRDYSRGRLKQPERSTERTG